MTRTKRLMVSAVGSVIGVPLAILLISPFAWSLLRPPPKLVSPTELPDLFPVLGFWRDATGPHCRAFLQVELRRGRDLPELSYAVPANERAICSESFDRYNSTGTWPDDLRWAHGVPGQAKVARFDVREIDSQTVEVYVSYGADDDAPNDSWYEVRAGAIPIGNPRHQRYFGPSLGLATIGVSIPSAIGLYLILATIWILRGGRRVASKA